MLAELLTGVPLSGGLFTDLYTLNSTNPSTLDPDSRNGTTFGCLFDGVTAGGEINAYAAQAFAEYSLKWLATNHDRLSIDDLAYGDQFREAFRQCTLFANSPDLARKAEGGSATAVMATVHRHRKNMYLLGASMGDAACMIVNDHSVELASTWQRAEFAGHDTGGQLSMCVGLQGVAATFKKPINKFNIIILATDGLTDNIHRAELEKILFFVVTSPAFNLPVTAELPGKGAALPKYSELSAMFGLTRAEPANMLSCEMVCRRIKHYIGWVTEALYEQEQHFYGLEVALKKASAEKDGAARLEIVRSALREAQNNAAMSAVPVPALPTAVSDDGKELLGVLEGYMASLYKERKRNHKAGKTDDAMVVVLKPLQKHAALR